MKYIFHRSFVLIIFVSAINTVLTVGASMIFGMNTEYGDTGNNMAVFDDRVILFGLFTDIVISTVSIILFAIERKKSEMAT